MKKLMITLSAAALATSVFAADIDTRTVGFETSEGYEVDSIVTTQTGGQGDKLWYSASADGETGTVKAYGETDGKLDGAGSNYLNVETTTGTPLYRKLVKHDAGELVNQDSDPVNIGDGIYVDTYVQFSASEEAPKLTDIANSKLVVWVKETVDEEASTSTTNLMITAAQLAADGKPTSAHFVIDIEALKQALGKDEFDLSVWHRLTIRAIENITIPGESNPNVIPGFVVFVDEKPVQANTGYTIGEYDVTQLTKEAKKFYDAKQLFVSLVQSGMTNSKALSAVGFDGTGQIDNVTVTTTAPQFAKGAYYFTITWEEGVKSFDLVYGETTESFTVDTATGSKEFEIPNTATTLKIANIVPTEGATIVLAEHEYTLAEVKAATIEADATQFEVNGEGCSSFAEALEKARNSLDKKISLYKDVTLTEAVTLEATDEIVLDLKGYTLTNARVYNNEDPVPLFVLSEGSKLTVITSVAGGKLLATDNQDNIFFGNIVEGKHTGELEYGSLTIGAAEGDAGVYLCGFEIAENGAEIVFVNGYFDSYWFGPADDFLNPYLADGSAVGEPIEGDDGYEYLPVTSAGGEDPEPEDNTIEVGGATKEFNSEEDALAAMEDIQITVSENDAAAGIDAAYFKPVIEKVNDAMYVVKVALDEDVVKPSADAATETFGSELTTAEVDNQGYITIKFTGDKVKKGLKYGVAVDEDLADINTATPELWEIADADGVDLKVKKPTGNQGFFKVHVKYEKVTK